MHVRKVDNVEMFCPSCGADVDTCMVVEFGAEEEICCSNCSGELESFADDILTTANELD